MKRFFLLIFVMIICNNIYSQGCSDAGFCSIGSIKNSASSASKNSLSFGAAFGMGEQSVSITTPYLQYDLDLKNNWQIQSKITYNSASKFNYSISGLGDAYLIATKTWGNKNKGKDAISFGIKFPLNNSDNKSNNAISLPLAYQTTLGTTDFILGYSTQVKTWSFAFAAQIPIANNNTNSFISPLTEPLKNFISTKELTRNSDLLIRATKVFETSKTINIRLGGLAIYHLGNDSYKDISGAKIEIKESTGLTFNINAGFNFKLNNKLSFDLLIASPVVVRKARPDGLTRSFVIVPELKWNL